MTRTFRTAQPWLTLAARLYLAYIWFDSGWPKLMDSAGTVRSVRAFQILPEALVPAFGYALPVVELALGVLLLVGLFTRWAAAATALMMAVFLAGIASAWIRGLSIDCGCFGNTGSYVADPVPGYIRDLARDTWFLAVAAFVALLPRTVLSADRFLAPSAGDRFDDGPDLVDGSTTDDEDGTEEGTGATGERAGVAEES